MKILIVEDEFLVAEYLKDTLENLGHRVLGPAHNCAAALEVLWAERPDAAIVDTELAGQTCEVVLEECAHQSVPVVISSGHMIEMLPDYAKGFPLLPKPFDKDAVAAIASTISMSPAN